MSFQLSAQAITAHTAITRMSVSRCSILPRQRGSTTAPKCPTSRSIAMLRSPTFGEEDHPWLSNSPASGISCVAPGGPSPANSAPGGGRRRPSDAVRQTHWAHLGVWERLLDLVQQRGIALGMTFLDGTNIRAHQKAAGAEKRGPTARGATAVKRLAVLVVATAPRPA